MPLLTSVAVYEVRQSSKTKDCSAAGCYKTDYGCLLWPPVCHLTPVIRGPISFLLFISENWDKDMGKSGHKFPERGTNVPENWDGIHFLLSIRYNFQFLFRGRLRSSAGLPMLGSLRLWKEGNPLHSKIFLYFFLEKSRSETDTWFLWKVPP